MVLSSVVPKILSSFCDSSRRVPPSDVELNLVKVCLQKYHGPCGNQRANLEKTLVALIDQDENVSQLELISEVLPLVSSAGGGGSSGMGHSVDWKGMTAKILAKMEDCIVTLYGDACPLLNVSD